MHRRLQLASLLIISAPVACALDVQVFDEGGGPLTTVTGSTTGGGFGGAGGAPGTGGDDVTVGFNTDVGSTVSTTASTTVSTSVSTTASTTATTSVTTSTSSGGPMPSIPCGPLTCTGSDVCCINFQQGMAACAPAGQCPSANDVEIACNGPMDCMMGQVCCGRFVQGAGYTELACTNSCQNGPNSLGVTMCGDDPMACGPNQTCEDSGALPQGYSFCDPP